MILYKVLIADNDILMCEALSIKISKNSNFEVINIVNTYEDVLEEYSKNPIDILFLGSHISGINCIETSQFINQSFPHTSIYVISSFQAKNLLKSKGNNAIQDIIEKPLNHMIINNILNSFAGKKEDLSYFNPFEELIKSIENKNYNDLDKDSSVNFLYEPNFIDSAEEKMIKQIDFFDNNRFLWTYRDKEKFLILVSDPELTSIERGKSMLAIQSLLIDKTFSLDKDEEDSERG